MIAFLKKRVDDARNVFGVTGGESLLGLLDTSAMMLQMVCHHFSINANSWLP